MSSSENQEPPSSSPEPFQSAQRPPDHFRPQEDDLGSSDEELPDAPYPNDETTAKASSEVPVAKAIGIYQADIEGEDSSPSDDEIPDQAADPTRPNRNRGPASTWRNWTASERELIASLDQLIAKDLSVHLYNAFMLKKRRIPVHEQQPLKASDGDELDDTTHWKPSKVWTAWPLPSTEVPREEGGEPWEEEGILGRPSVKQRKPSETLRELLVAQVLRYARESFQNRESDDPSLERGDSEEETPLKLPARAPNYAEVSDKSKKLKPVVIADDEQAGKILRPTVQHVLAKLDDLLMGLHHARSSYFPVDESVSDSKSRATQRLTSRHRARKRKRDASIHKSDEVVTSNASASSGTEDKSRSKASSRSKSHSRQSRARNTDSRRKKLGLRDWSDVLGIASMTGWDPNVVERAAARCSSLFGEGLTFRTLEEGKPGFTERSYLPNAMEPMVDSEGEYEVEERNVSGGKRADEMCGGVHVDGFLQPIEGKKSWKYSNKSPGRRSKSQRSRGQSAGT